MALGTGPPGSQADDPVSSFDSGIPNKITPPTPTDAASLTTGISSSTESWDWPGIEPIGLETPLPGTTKRGRTNEAGWSRVSAT